MAELLAIKELQDDNFKKYGTYEHVIEKKKKKKTWSRLFQDSPEWKELRSKFFAASDKVCIKCGSVEQLQVDHIKPKYKYKELALEWSNLRILCWPCNSKKNTKED